MKGSKPWKSLSFMKLGLVFVGYRFKTLLEYVKLNEN